MTVSPQQQVQQLFTDPAQLAVVLLLVGVAVYFLRA